MKSRIIIRRLAVIACAGLVAAACGGADDPDLSSETLDSDGASETATSDDEPVSTETEASPEDAEMEDAREFFSNETLTFVVALAPGGGYDQMARSMAPYLEDYLDTTVTVENRPGAGGLLALNSLWNEKNDGSVFGIMLGQGAAGAIIADREGVEFTLEEFSFLARPAASPRVMVTGPESGLETIEDVMASENFTFASSGPGGNDHQDAVVMFEALDLSGEIITGYSSGSEAGLSVISGETDGSSGSFPSRWPNIETGDMIPVLAIADDRIEQIPDVPSVLELDLSEESAELAEAHLNMQAMGRALLAPPDVPEARLQLLREAFKAVITNEELVEELAAQSIPMDYLSGPEYRDLALQVVNAPESYADALRRATEEE